MSFKEKLKTWRPCHVLLKKCRKKTEEADISLETKFSFNFRHVNALDFNNFFRIDLLKIP